MQAQDAPPAGYRFIEYAESDGNARIALPFGFSPNDTITTYASVTNLGVDRYLVAPSVWNDAINRFAMVGGYRNSFNVALGSHTTSMASLNMPKDTEYHLWTYDNWLFSIDNDHSYDASGASWGSDTQNLYLFYGYNSNTSGKITYYDHQKPDGAHYHIVPIQHKQTGTVEMYDTVSKTIMTRTGTLYPPT